MNFPAGLMPNDHSIEFFRDSENPEISHAIMLRMIMRVKDLPDDIKKSLWADIMTHPDKSAWLKLNAYTGDAALEKYCSCVFGLIDHEADFANGIFFHSEYVPCEIRETCSGNGILCNKLTVGDGQELTSRQVAVLTQIGRCRLNKEIADSLSISPETVKIHIKHIQQKAGVMNKKDLVLLAHKKQLV
ncbi:MAG TPA: helix-turn-helix transcriptional regulator [Mucilaginibacter sp.]|nr:helix-turn-helix transcriptional regulator [Mucilaginibacter sp.]